MLAEHATPAPVGDGHLAPKGFVAVMADQYATHQMNLTWATSSKQETVVLCNCGWVGTRWRPEALGSIQTGIAEYEAHLVEAGYVIPAQREL